MQPGLIHGVGERKEKHVPVSLKGKYFSGVRVLQELLLFLLKWLKL